MKTKNLISNKSGMSLGSVLALVTFILGSALALFSYSVSQTLTLDHSVDKTEAYYNSVQLVSATSRIIAREKNTDVAYLSSLASFMDVSIVKDATDPFLYRIASDVNTTQDVSAYFSTAGLATNTYDLIFDSTGAASDPNFNLAGYITPSSLISSFLPDYLQDQSGIVLDPDFGSISDVNTYLSTLPDVSGSGFVDLSRTYFDNAKNYNLTRNSVYDYFVSGSTTEKRDVTVKKGKSLVVSNNKLLIIRGDLFIEPQASLYGNFIVDGNVKFLKGSQSQVSVVAATIYCGGSVTLDIKVQLGTTTRPTFIFSEGSVTMQTQVTGTGFFLSTDVVIAKPSTINITGGIYVDSANNEVKNATITQYVPNSTTGTNFYPQAVPESLYVQIEGTPPDEPGGGEIAYTYPMLGPKP